MSNECIAQQTVLTVAQRLPRLHRSLHQQGEHMHLERRLVRIYELHEVMPLQQVRHEGRDDAMHLAEVLQPERR